MPLRRACVLKSACRLQDNLHIHNTERLGYHSFCLLDFVFNCLVIPQVEILRWINAHTVPYEPASIPIGLLPRVYEPRLRFRSDYHAFTSQSASPDGGVEMSIACKLWNCMVGPEGFEPPTKEL